jgi:hypothetical protein
MQGFLMYARVLISGAKLHENSGFANLPTSSLRNSKYRTEYNKQTNSYCVSYYIQFIVLQFIILNFPRFLLFFIFANTIFAHLIPLRNEYNIG